MCSIALSSSHDETKRMLSLMRHRSPDGRQILPHRGYYIGMGRLAVIDTGSTAYPFADNEATLSFNGMIFNYIELREELIKEGVTFTTNGDTEVLFRAIQQWGINEALDKVNGMFAFVYAKGDAFFLVRDIAGEKPLYYTEEPFMVASEKKALKGEIHEVPPAHYVIKHKYGFEKPVRWWNFTPNETLHDLSDRELVDRLDTLLEDAIRMRTRSDVPYALYYSGGIDSTLIKLYHHFEEKLTYVDDDKKQEFLTAYDSILWHLEDPVRSFSAFGLWSLARQAHDRLIQVVISGEGADELFGGYTRYVHDAFNQNALKTFPSYTEVFPYSGDPGWSEFNGNLRELLRMGDRMASAWGIENRCPFLDRRIIEFAFSIPFERKVDGLLTKKLLRGLIKKKYKSYVFKEKHGLFCSTNEWLGHSKPLDKDFHINSQKERLSILQPVV